MRFVSAWALALFLACPAFAGVVGRPGPLPASWAGALGSLPPGARPPSFLAPLFASPSALQTPALTPVASALEAMGLDAAAFRSKTPAVQSALLIKAARAAVLSVGVAADGAVAASDGEALRELRDYHEPYLDARRLRAVLEKLAAANAGAADLAERTASALGDVRRPETAASDPTVAVSKCPFHRLLGLTPSSPRPARHAEAAAASDKLHLGTGGPLRLPVLEVIRNTLRALWQAITFHDPFAGRPAPPRIGIWKMIKLGASNLRNPVAAFEAVQRDYGDIAYLKLPTGDRFVIVSDPEVVAKVLAGTEKTFQKSDLLTAAFGRLTGPDTIFLGKGADWLSRRKLMQPYFTQKTLHSDESAAEMLGIVDGALDELAVRAADGGAEIKVSDEMTAMTINVILGLLFKSHLSREALFQEIMPAFQETTSWLVPEALNPFGRSLSALPRVFKGQRRLAEAYATLHVFAARLQEEAGVEDGDYLLKTMLAAKAEGKLSDEEVRREILTMVLAGHETTSATLAWALQSLANDPASMERLLREIDETTGGAKPTPEQLRRGFLFLDQVVDETLRLYSPAYVLFRKAPADVSIATKKGEVFIPAGAHVIMPTYVTHRRDEQWAKSGYPAGEFHPERLDPANIMARGLKAEDLRAFAFGGGQRLCIGSHLSILETKLILIRLLQRFKLAPANPGPARMVSNSSVKIADGFPARLTLR